MRPLDKGDSPYTEIQQYQDAEPYLEKRIGRYCSFCEMKVTNALAVEHKESKNSGGALTEWSNLLLSCTYCNSRKLEKIKKGELEKWIWPDMHNTFLAFSYENAVPKVNEDYLRTVSEEIFGRAKAIFEGLALDYRPDATLNGSGKKKYKDKRWQSRFETLGVAEESREIWKKYKDTEVRKSQLANIINLAKGYGFFSVWMMVFKDEPEIKKELIKAFPGTASKCFDENAYPVRREKSEL